MIEFQRHTLKNGLRVLVHEDATTPLVSCNIVYNVGSKNEAPNQTGMAHLFEHYMFCGSQNIRDYDVHLQNIGGINNAYTSQDITHYYLTLPANNLETAFWLESDRMLGLAFDQNELDVQKKVVIEEFKENYLNRPFGDMFSLFNAAVFEQHPYQWLPIGKEVAHIEQVTMPMMKDFFYRFYRPSNAVLAVAGNVHFDEVVRLAEKWFGEIPSRFAPLPPLPEEPPQTQAKRVEVRRPVPYDMLMKGWKMCGRTAPEYYTMDLLSDLFGSGKSSYLYKKFVTEQPLFTDLSACLTETLDTGVFIIVGRPADGITLADADAQLSRYLFDFQFDRSLSKDVQNVKNSIESFLLSSEIKIEDRSSALAIAETYSCAEDFQDEQRRYFAVTDDDVITAARALFKEESCTTLFYSAE